MKRLCGFALFFFTIGIAFGWCVTNHWHQFFCTIICLIISYCLFFH